MEIVITLVVAALLGLIPAKIAQSKGYSFGKWWVYGFLIFIVAIIHSCVLKSKNTSTIGNADGGSVNTSDGSTRKCPYCAETIKSEAKICRFCNKELEPEIETTAKESLAENKDTKKSQTKGILAILLIVGVIVLGVIMIVIAI